MKKVKEKKKWNWKKILKWTGIGLGVAAVSYVGYKFITEPDTDVDDIRVLEKKTLDDMLHTSYENGRHDELWDIITWTRDHGKCILASTSSKGFEDGDEEHWLVGELLNLKPTDCCDVHGNVSDIFIANGNVD